MKRLAAKMGFGKSKPEVKVGPESLEEKSNDSEGQSCQKISKDEFDAQFMGAGGTSESIKELLDVIIKDTSLGLVFRLEKLKKFRVEYPFIFKENNGEEALQQVKIALKEENAKEGNAIVKFFKLK